MMTFNELMDFRLQQRIAEEIYRQQIMQRIPDPFAAMMPFPMPTQLLMTSTQPPLPGVKAKLENNDLWQQFHQIGTEMIITKCGRRMFPSTRISLSGLEEEANYCVLLEMVPIGDCRYKFSGSQWVPAGGAEPQSPQRMYLHPDSPASGSHWQAQPILFNKVKLTNNTLDNSGHIVLASMHKYQPRIHVIRTSDLTQIPWAPQQAFVFTETEFVAVTAYQNDRITKLKIDHNPFAKGFRETSQSRCKRKMSSSPTLVEVQPIRSELSRDISSDDDRVSISGDEDSQQTKRRRNSTTSPPLEDKSIACVRDTAEFHYAAAMAANLTCASTAFTRSHYEATHNTHLCLHSRVDYAAHTLANPYLEQLYSMPANDSQSTASVSPGTDAFVDVTSLEDEQHGSVVDGVDGTSVTVINRRNSFSISAILGSRNVVTT